MARFDTSGLDGIISEMERMGQGSGVVAEQMVNAAVGIIRDEWKKSADRHGHRDTGDMIAAISIGDSIHRAGDSLSRDVYPRGVDRRGRRNAEKAFILNYGTSKIPASYWVFDADERSAAPVAAKCNEIWNNFLESGR